ncbi:MAG: LacI family transcriptional regulator, partial [Spirochaetales bacterium]|nr:LacI family transcriptional regulator [Spirochaetales bacterium]
PWASVTATIKDVAKKARVSTATVSRVVNNDNRISSSTRLRVQKAIVDLDYKVNTVARSLKKKRTLTVGVLAPEIANIFFMRVAQGVEDRLGDDGYSMIVVSSREDTTREARAVELLLEKQVDGVIVIPVGDRGDHLEAFRRGGVPTVLVDRLVEGFDADAVLVDNEDATYRAVRRLHAEGRDNFAFIGGQHTITTAAERYRGFARALEDIGRPLQERNVRLGDFHTESGFRLFGELVTQAVPPTTIMVANYFMHIGALRYATLHRGRVPADLFLASFDTSEFSAVAGIPGLSIAQPIDRIGRRAAEVLLERIGGARSGPPRVERLPTHIVLTGGYTNES